MFVFICSVHHTGTQFTQKLFTDLGYEITDKTPKEAGNSVNYLHRCHIADSVLTELLHWLHMGVPIVVPLRHPMEVARSWLARGKPISEMVRQFQILDELVEQFMPLYLPIDQPYRETYLHHLRLECDPNLNTDWQKVSSKVVGSDHPAQLKPVEPNAEEYRQLQALNEMTLLKGFYPGRWLL